MKNARRSFLKGLGLSGLVVSVPVTAETAPLPSLYCRLNPDRLAMLPLKEKDRLPSSWEVLTQYDDVLRGVSWLIVRGEGLPETPLSCEPMRFCCVEQVKMYVREKDYCGHYCYA